ncbi:hypothetical protein Goari_011044 [Gossypium aridum]|uniref:Bifunctional inhibitor/plant lipid transfer protein/seed storage helical domain-containing protein n=1 Tax=Gossypium aridum TaxID=34290 RepID=A0A7J8WW46_GOSAI|nr:hypothetical protein [Gossypium aridum]
MKGLVISVIVVVTMVQFMAEPGETAVVSCDEVDECLVYYVPYLTSRTGYPSALCCGGLAKLEKIAVTTAEKQTACSCIKQAAAGFPSIKEDVASSNPNKCNVQFN